MKPMNQTHAMPGKPFERDAVPLHIKVPVIVKGERVAAFKTTNDARRYAEKIGGHVGNAINTDFGAKLAASLRLTVK